MLQNFDSDAAPSHKLLHMFHRLMLGGRRHVLSDLAKAHVVPPKGEAAIGTVIGGSLEEVFEKRRGSCT